MRKVRKNVGKIIRNVIYVLIIVPLIIASICIIYQKIFEPEKIPDIFGIKMFVVFYENTDESLEYGDLVITYNQAKDKIKANSIIVYRNDIDVVTISSKYANMDKFEGVVVKRIPKLGSVMYFISRPLVIIIISCIILIIGSICTSFARKLDEKEIETIENEEHKEETQKDSNLV